jgi:hypothetical protein
VGNPRPGSSPGSRTSAGQTRQTILQGTGAHQGVGVQIPPLAPSCESTLSVVSVGIQRFRITPLCMQPDRRLPTGRRTGGVRRTAEGITRRSASMRPNDACAAGVAKRDPPLVPSRHLLATREDAADGGGPFQPDLSSAGLTWPGHRTAAGGTGTVSIYLLGDKPNSLLQLSDPVGREYAIVGRAAHARRLLMIIWGAGSARIASWQHTR